MYILTANDWREGPEQKASNPPNRKEHNEEMKQGAEHYADEMRKSPSQLERMMMEFLDNNNIQYEFQRIFYIKDKAGLILKYYIADFYVPRRKVVIEVDGKFHEKRKIQDERRSDELQRQHTRVKVMRVLYKDMCNYNKMKTLLKSIR